MILLKFDSGFGPSVVIEDDGRACYAYLMLNGQKEFATDVWLYNIHPTPPEPEWTLPNAKELMPFMNSAEYVVDEEFAPIASASEIKIYFGELDGRLQAAIHIRGQYHALLYQGESPSYCRLAQNPGPLAKPLPRRHERNDAF